MTKSTIDGFSCIPSIIYVKLFPVQATARISPRIQDCFLANELVVSLRFCIPIYTPLDKCLSCNKHKMHTSAVIEKGTTCFGCNNIFNFNQTVFCTEQHTSSRTIFWPNISLHRLKNIGVRYLGTFHFSILMQNTSCNKTYILFLHQILTLLDPTQNHHWSPRRWRGNAAP